MELLCEVCSKVIERGDGATYVGKNGCVDLCMDCFVNYNPEDKGSK